jgi:Flp pilus assembly pilin Flp
MSKSFGIRSLKHLRRQKNKRGQTLVEYALILAFISVVAIGVLLALGGTVSNVFTAVQSNMANAVGSH